MTRNSFAALFGILLAATACGDLVDEQSLPQAKPGEIGRVEVNPPNRTLRGRGSVKLGVDARFPRAVEGNLVELGEEELPPSEGEGELPPPNEGEDELPPPSEGEDELPPPSEGEDELPPSEGEDELPPPSEGEDELPPPSEGEDEPSPEPEGNPVGNGAATSQHIDDNGGSLTVEGTVLDIPANALASGVEISVTSSTVPAPEQFKALSPVFTFGPDGTVFNEPATVTFPLPAGATNAVVYWTNESGTGFVALGGAIDREAGTISVIVEHFSEGFVGEGGAGVALWADDYGDGATGWDSVQQIVRYDGDEFIAVGWYESGLNLGSNCGGPRTTVGQYASYVARFNSLRQCVWMDVIETDDGWPVSVAVDSQKNIYVVGMFYASLDFAGTAHDLAGNGLDYDVFVARYSTTNDVQTLNWTKHITGDADQWVYEVAVLEDGGAADVVLAGSLYGTAQFDQDTALIGAADYDMWVARYDENKNNVFATLLASSDSGIDEALAIGTNSLGEVIVGGYSDGSFTVGANTTTNAGGADILLFGLNGATGAATWVKGFGGAGDDFVNDLAVASNDDIMLTGSFKSSVTFAPQATLNGPGRNTFLLARLDADGDGIFSTSVSGPNARISGTSLALGSGVIYVSALIGSGGANFGGGELVHTDASDMAVIGYDWDGVNLTANHSWSMLAGGAGDIMFPLIALLDSEVIVGAEFTGELSSGDVTPLGSASNTTADFAFRAFDR